MQTSSRDYEQRQSLVHWKHSTQEQHLQINFQILIIFGLTSEKGAKLSIKQPTLLVKYGKTPYVPLKAGPNKCLARQSIVVVLPTPGGPEMKISSSDKFR